MRCKSCDKKISKEEKRVSWITSDKSVDIEIVYWHYECFLKWRDASLEARAMGIYNKTMQNIMPMAGAMVKKILDDAESNKDQIR